MVQSQRHIADYDALFDPGARGAPGRGRPAGRRFGESAQALLQLVAHDGPPVHLLLGKDAVALVRAKLTALGEEITDWEAVSASTRG